MAKLGDGSAMRLQFDPVAWVDGEPVYSAMVVFDLQERVIDMQYRLGDALLTLGDALRCLQEIDRAMAARTSRLKTPEPPLDIVSEPK